MTHLNRETRQNIDEMTEDQAIQHALYLQKERNWWYREMERIITLNEPDKDDRVKTCTKAICSYNEHFDYLRDSRNWYPLPEKAQQAAF